MGRQKALLQWDGATLLEYHLTQLAALNDLFEIIVVTGHEPARITEIASVAERTRVAHNSAYRNGKVGSILTGLRATAANADAVMLLAVDQPRAAAVLRTILDTHESSGSLIAVPVHLGRRGHPPIFRRALLPELLAMTEETQGPRAVMLRHEADICEVECDASVLVDLNQPSDVSNVSESG